MAPTRPTTQVNVHEAKTQLSKLLARVEDGEEIVIARAGRPVAKLVKVERPNLMNAFGALKDTYGPMDDAIWVGPQAEALDREIWGDLYALPGETTDGDDS